MNSDDKDHIDSVKGKLLSEVAGCINFIKSTIGNWVQPDTHNIRYRDEQLHNSNTEIKA